MSHHRNLLIFLTCGAVLAGTYLLLAAAPPAGSPEALRQIINSAYQGSRYDEAIAAGENLLKGKQPLGKAGVSFAESLLARSKYDRACELLLKGEVDSPSSSLWNRAGMALHCGNAAQQKLAIGCIKQALAMEPENHSLAGNLIVAYWNAGYIPEAKAECERLLSKDKANVQALQILERIEKRDFWNVLKPDTLKHRKVQLRLKADRGLNPVLEGSWNKEGKLDQFGGWAPQPMKLMSDAGPNSVFATEVELATESGRWYSALVRSGNKSPDGKPNPALYLSRFPVYPTTSTPLDLWVDESPVQVPKHLLAPRPPFNSPRKLPAGTVPRTILICVDSDTWNIVMPLVKAGAMPHLAQLMAAGSASELHSDPPISTIAFDRISFGKSGTFGWFDWVSDSIETLKEKGFDLIHAGDIAGTNSTWKRIAEAGHPSLYISWAEELFYDEKGKETVEHYHPDPVGIDLAGTPVPADPELLPEFLDQREVTGPVKPQNSDHVVLDLAHSGLKRFAEAKELLNKYHPALTFIHFGFIDTSYHLLWETQDSDIPFLRPGFKAPQRHRLAIAGLHRLMDTILYELAKDFYEDGHNVILFSDHGATGGFASTWLGHEPIGMVVAAGPSFKTGVRQQPPPDIDDVAPTLNAIYGLPKSAVYKGKPFGCYAGPASPDAVAPSPSAKPSASPSPK